MIEYKEFEFDGTGTESMLRGLNEAGKDDWLLSTPLKQVDSRKVVCIMSKRRQGRPPREENNET